MCPHLTPRGHQGKGSMVLVTRGLSTILGVGTQVRRLTALSRKQLMRIQTRIGAENMKRKERICETVVNRDLDV